MAKIGGVERMINALTINGKPYSYNVIKILKIDLPTKDRPYWIIEREGEIIIYVTGEVSLEVSPTSGQPKEERNYDVGEGLAGSY